MTADRAPADWFLTPEERGNPGTAIDLRHGDGRAYTEGNRVEPLVHGATYFRRLCEELAALGAGDRVLFTDWRGDPDELLVPGGPTVEEALCHAVRRGVDVRGLVWRSHADRLSFSEKENRHLGTAINRAGGEVLLDDRVRRVGSHHQKLVIVRHAGREDDDLAFVGGIDLSHARRDDAEHRGDPQPQPMDHRYGPRAPWHDAMIEVHGPAVGDLVHTFVERWSDPAPVDHRNPYRVVVNRLTRAPRHPKPLGDLLRDPGPVGPHAVQVLRTYASKTRPYPFAPAGERSIARAYLKALGRARRFVYVEDQYLWSEEVARVFADALRRQPRLHLIAVLPRYPDADGAFTGPPNRLGQVRALQMLRAAGGDRVGVYDIENADGVPIYVHAKVCVIDDVWAIVGSDNLNRRSWTHDSELSCAVLDATYDDREPADPGGLGDGARVFPRTLRLSLWAEHLGCSPDDPRLLDVGEAAALWRERARALDRWHSTGWRGDRPPGQARAHRPASVPLVARPWAQLLYHLVYDPDGRPRAVRRVGGF